MASLYEKTYNNAKAGKKGNLICNFKTIFDSDVVDVYELRECPYDSSIYVVWWDESVLGVGRDNFTTYEKYEVEAYFAEENSWKVVGNKCKRAIFKQPMGDEIIV